MQKTLDLILIHKWGVYKEASELLVNSDPIIGGVCEFIYLHLSRTTKVVSSAVDGMHI